MGARLPTFALLTTLGCGLGGCGFFFEPKPDLKDTKTASVASFTVEVPGNWKTELETEDIDGTTLSTLSIESSGNAIALVQVFEPGIDMPPDTVFDTYVEGVLEASKTEFGGVIEVALRGSEEFVRPVMDTTWLGRRGTLDLALLGESVPNRIQTLQRYTEDQTVIIVMQAPLEDWNTVQPGFDFIYDGISAQ